MKFSGKMYFNIILKVTKNQGSTLSVENTFFRKPQGGQFDPPPPPRRHIRVKPYQGKQDRGKQKSNQFHGDGEE